MAQSRISRFRCTDCPERFTFQGSQPKREKGAMLKVGREYCKGGEKIRVFRPGDPKIYPPHWCPRRKEPAEYRVYSYKNDMVLYLRQMLARDGVPHSPSGYEYVQRAEGTVSLSAGDFQKALKEQSVSKLLGIPVSVGDVVEIDDGLRPWFFHVTNHGVDVLLLFHADAARAGLCDGDSAP